MVVIFYILHYVAGGEKILRLRLYKMVKPNSNLSCKLNIFISLILNVSKHSQVPGRKTRSCLELISNLAKEDFVGWGRARVGGLS